MIDIKLLRENSGFVKKNIAKRQDKNLPKLIDEFLLYDGKWRKYKVKLDELRKKKNQISLEINKAKKERKNINVLLKEGKELPDKIKKLETETDDLKQKIDNSLLRIPNILHENAPIGKDEKDNRKLRKHGQLKKFNFELKNHEDLIESLRCADFEAGRTNSGQGFNYLLDKVALLDHALQRYGIDFVLKNGFKLVVPPMLLRRNVLLGALNGLQDFEQVVYKIENEDIYLIGTAEHSLVTMLKDKLLKKEELPIKVCALTSCFRKEIGSHGVDTKGLFRMHQFNKVEQVIFCKPEDSYKYLEEMQKITEKFFQSLKIPYRVVEICSGDLGNKFAKQYDIEAWFPRQNKYREVTSAGNCTDYQARALNIKYLDGKEKKYVHILNNTMVATSRAMVAIIENYQEKDGSINIPIVLQPYMCNLKKIK